MVAGGVGILHVILLAVELVMTEINSKEKSFSLGPRSQEEIDNRFNRVNNNMGNNRDQVQKKVQFDHDRNEIKNTPKRNILRKTSDVENEKSEVYNQGRLESTRNSLSKFYMAIIKQKFDL